MERFLADLPRQNVDEPDDVSRSSPTKAGSLGSAGIPIQNREPPFRSKGGRNGR